MYLRRQTHTPRASTVLLGVYVDYTEKEERKKPRDQK